MTISILSAKGYKHLAVHSTTNESYIQTS